MNPQPGPTLAALKASSRPAPRARARALVCGVEMIGDARRFSETRRFSEILAHPRRFSEILASPQKLSQILGNLEILRDSSDGARTVRADRPRAPSAPTVLADRPRRLSEDHSCGLSVWAVCLDRPCGPFARTSLEQTVRTVCLVRPRGRPRGTARADRCRGPSVLTDLADPLQSTDFAKYETSKNTNQS